MKQTLAGDLKTTLDRIADSAALSAIGHFLVPVLIVFGIGADMSRGDNGIDEYIYVGAVSRLQDYIVRFPTGYYQSRWGYILPEQLAESLLGPTVGFFALRLGLLGLIGVVIGWSTRKSINGLIGGLLFAGSPIVLRSMLDTYTDSLAVPFLVLAVAILAQPSERPVVYRAQLLVGGSLLALAWNAHLVLLLPCAALIGVVALESGWSKRSLAAGIDAGVLVGAGTLLTTAVAILYYGIRFDAWDMYGNSARQAASQTNSVFIDSNPTWFSYRDYLLIMPVVMVFALVTISFTKDAKAKATLIRMSLFATSIGFVFAWFEFVRGAPLLQVFYYSCYPLSVFLLLMAKSVVVSLDEANYKLHFQTLLVGITYFSAIVLLDRWKPRYLTVILATSIAMTASIAIAKRTNLPEIPVMVFALLVGWLTVVAPHNFPETSTGFSPDPTYDQILLEHGRGGLDLISASREFAESLPSYPEDDGQIRVWFDGQGATNQVLSTMLHWTSALNVIDDQFLPTLGDFEIARLNADRPRYLVILASSETNLTDGLVALEANSQPYTVSWIQDQSHGDVASFVALLERSDGNSID